MRVAEQAPTVESGVVQGKSIPFVFKVVLVWLVFATTTLVAWTKQDWFPLTGDEPHYLVIADGLVRYGSFEQTKPYKDEFMNREIFPAGLAPADAEPDPGNTHAVRGPNGLYNVHNIGLPILLAPAFAIAGVLGAKFWMVLLNGAIVALAWAMTGLYTDNRKTRLTAVAATVFGMPFLSGAGQLYPDLAAGAICLGAVVGVLFLRAQRSIPPSLELCIALSVALLPWLQVKFAAAAMVAVLGLAWASRQAGRSLGRSLIFPAALAASLIGVALYNLHAFGKASGPYQDGALQLSLQSLTVFLGLHFDRMQGLFFQNPIWLFVAVFLIPFLRRDIAAGLIMLAIYGALTIPNSMHPNWYGGWSFVGRFAWSGITTMLPLGLFACVGMAQSPSRLARMTLMALIVLQAVLWVRYTFFYFDFYPASGVWVDGYRAHLSPFAKLMPVFLDHEFAFSFAPNWIVVFAFCALVGLGACFSGPMGTWAARSAVLGAAAAFGIVIIAGVFTAPDYKPVHLRAADLPSQTGRLAGASRKAESAIDGQGYLTFGPYWTLGEGRYRFEIVYSTSSVNDKEIGTWDVFTPKRGGLLASGSFPNTDGQTRTLTGEFEVPSALAYKRFEVRGFYTGNGSLQIDSLTLYHF